MATLAALGGNWSTNTNWAVCDATSESDSEAANTALTTSYVVSSTFTPGAITIDGIAIKVASRAASPTGTLTVTLDQGGSDVSGTPTTINVSDIDTALGWLFIKFASSKTLTGATAYGVKAKTSSSSQVNLYSTATTNWSRQLRTTTNPGAAPVAGDKIIVTNEKTGAGTQNTITATLDGDQSAVSLGATAFLQSIHVSNGGTLTFSTGAGANPKIKWKGLFSVFGGTLNVGTSGTPIPSGSIADLAMDVSVNVDSGLVFNNGSNVNIYGVSKATVATLMTADKAAAATVITLASTSGWAISDVLAFASTTRTAADCESKIISAVDSSTQVTLTAGLTNAHSGTSPTQAEVINLTRNVKIHGTSASLQGYVLCAATAVVNVQYAEFTQLGSATTNKRGIDVQTTTGTFIFRFNSVHDFAVASSVGVNSSGTSGQTAATYIFSNNVIYGMTGAGGIGFTIGNATTGTWVIDSNVGINSQGAMFNLLDVGGTFTNNTAVGGTTGITANETGPFVSFSGNTSHSNSGVGCACNAFSLSTLSSLTVWRNGSTGFALANTSNSQRSLVIDGLVAFGNLTRNVQVNLSFDLLFTNAVISGDSSFATATGVHLDNSANVSFEGCTFGVAAGIKVAHSSQDLLMNTYCTAVLRNCNLASTTPVASWAATALVKNAFVLSQKHGQINGNHRFWLQYGTGVIDTVIFNTASPSLRLTPNTAGSKLESAPPGGYGATAAVSNGGTITASVYIRRSVVGDGAAYNGNAPRLIVRKNIAAGIAADTALITSSASAGTWEQLSGVTAAVTDDAVLEFIVDCDGTAGWVNTDDWNFTPVADTKGGKYYTDGVPLVSGDNSAGGTILARVRSGF